MGKQVKTPRFYVDIPTFLHATGQLGWDSSKGGANLLYMNPSNPYFQETDSNTMFVIGNLTNNTPKTSFPINFCALLNHNFASDTNNYNVYGKASISLNGSNQPDFSESFSDSSFTNRTSVLNYDGTDGINAQYNGTTIWTFSDANGMDKYWRNFDIYFTTLNEGNAPYNYDDYPHQLGSFVVGKYWDAPNSPDLSLTMSRRFDGIKKQKTIGGKTFANIYYDGPTEWTMNHKQADAIPSQVYKYPPFELDSIYGGASEGIFNQRAKSGLGRKGLRSWNLTFSYISEDDMWMENEVSNTLISDSESNTSLNDPNPMLSDDSFNFVWNCTLGGTLPFIFQPDNTNNNPDQFSICTFRDNTLSVKQVAHNTYSLSITIDEVA
jgi:hypothetical protein